MQGRTIDMYARPSFRFINIIEDLIADADDLLIANKKLTGLKPIYQALESLRKTVTDPAGKLGVKAALKEYEIARTKSLGTIDTLDREYDKAAENKQKAEELYNKLPEQHELDLARQKELRNRTVEDLNKEGLNTVKDEQRDTTNFIVESETRATKIDTKQNEVNKLVQKIQANCCGAELCNKKDIARVRSLEFEIKVLEAQNEILKDELSKKNANSLTGHSSTKEKLEKKLAAEKKQIDDLIDTYDARRKAARKKLDETTTALNSIEKKIEQNLLDQCKNVDRDTMFDLVHLRARISNFFSAVETVYKNDKSTKATLDALLSKKADRCKKLDDALDCIYYPALDGRSGLNFYTAYLDWVKTHQARQQEIESSVYSPNEVIDDLVPEIKQENTAALRNSTLGTVHDFFPREAKNKKLSASADASNSLALTSSSSTPS